MVPSPLDFFVLAIEGNADKNTVNENVPHQWIRIGQAGTGFKRFAEEKVQDVIMIGTIRRPSFFDLVPDLRTTAFFAKIGTKALGDDGILRALVKEIEAEGMGFDPNLHNAVMQEPCEEDDKHGKVAQVLQKGYQYKGKVIRYSIIKVYE